MNKIFWNIINAFQYVCATSILVFSTVFIVGGYWIQGIVSLCAGVFCWYCAKTTHESLKDMGDI